MLLRCLNSEKMVYYYPSQYIQAYTHLCVLSNKLEKNKHSHLEKNVFLNFCEGIKSLSQTHIF